MAHFEDQLWHTYSQNARYMAYNIFWDIHVVMLQAASSPNVEHKSAPMTNFISIVCPVAIVATKATIARARPVFILRGGISLWHCAGAPPLHWQRRVCVSVIATVSTAADYENNTSRT